MSDQAIGAAARPATSRRWWWALGAIVIVGLVLRVVYVAVWRWEQPAGGDAYWYHHAANLFVDGEGFVNPYLLLVRGIRDQTAGHPPLYVFYLSITSVLGLRSWHTHQLWTAMLGGGTVLLVGLAGRRIAGHRAALIAAAIAALHPNFWLNDGIVLSESLVLATTALVLLTAYRFWHHRSFRTAVEFGVAGALATLTRSEAILLLPLISVPLVVWLRPVPWRRRLELLGAAALAAVVVIGPWVLYNLSRFERPVLLSSQFELTEAQANCDSSYNGRFVGYFDLQCFLDVEIPSGLDESERAVYYGRAADEYRDAHADRVVPIMGTRVARAFGFFRPFDQIRLDTFMETRERPAALTGLWSYWAMCVAAGAGAVVLRHRRVPILPLLAIPLTVAVAVAITFGQTRYRASVEVLLAILTGVAVDAALRRWRPSSPFFVNSPSMSDAESTKNREDDGEAALTPVGT